MSTTTRPRRLGRIPAPYYWMTIPALVLFLVFLVYPFLQGIFYTFTNYPGYGSWDFIGLQNYLSLFQDSVVWKSYGFTFQYTIACTILVNIIAMLIALGLNAKIRGRNFWRATYFIPYVLPVLVVAYVFKYIFNYLVPGLAEKLSLTSLTTSLLASESSAWVAIVIVGVWQAAAFSIIIYLAGLQTVPTEVYEASALDGATGWKQFWRITFPLIMPYFTINVVISFKGFLGVFDQVVALTSGGPGTATQSVSFLIFKNGFQGGEYAYQTANGVVYFIILILLSMAQLIILQRREANFQ